LGIVGPAARQCTRTLAMDPGMQTLEIVLTVCLIFPPWSGPSTHGARDNFEFEERFSRDGG